MSSGLPCPRCSDKNSSVVDSRYNDEGISPSKPWAGKRANEKGSSNV